MITVERTFTVGRAPDFVVDYLADFNHAEQWDPGTVSCTRLDSGPVRVGSSWRNVSKVLGRNVELTYRLQTRDPDRVVLVGDNKSAQSTDDIAVREHPDGSQLTYQARIDLRGASRIAEPLMRLAFERIADKTVTQMQSALAQAS